MAHKKPKQAYNPHPEKRAQNLSPQNAENQTIRYLFVRFDPTIWHDNQYSPIVFGEIANHLKSFERMTWRDLRTRNPKHDHPIALDRLVPEARKRLEALKFDDFDEMWRLRLSGECRLWGLKIGREFYVLWWDPQHKVCPSHLKNN